MKAGLITVFLGLSVILSACGNGAKVIEGEVKNTVSESEESDTAAMQETKESEEVQKEISDEQEKNGYVFCYHDTVIEIDADAQPVIAALGEANSYFEAASCAFDGLDKIYTYNSFEIDTYPQGEIDCISTVIFKDDSIMTAEGISIGDSMDKVMEIYGEAYTEKNGAIEYEKDGMKLVFIIQDGRVASIEYRSTVLEQ